jgi:hypothetical protein
VLRQRGLCVLYVTDVRVVCSCNLGKPSLTNSVVWRDEWKENGKRKAMHVDLERYK